MAAFTLAEVLITLGIIGIVASLTMPSLIANYQKKVTALRVKQAYSMLSQAVKLSEIDNGPFPDWDLCLGQSNGLHNTELVVDKYFIPYFKELRFCSNGLDKTCGASVGGFGKNYVLPNGVGIAFLPAEGCNPNIAIIVIGIDVNGSKPPNTPGLDGFGFTLDPNFKIVVPGDYKENFTRQDIINGYRRAGDNNLVACNNNSANITHRYLCTWLLMVDGWEIKDDYPW
ncbi:MAG: hypothetical protein LBK53_01345 [Heliobacteriaceae bacterium]|jgi:hypothetical protein|nr:hypothetical protein [Heliobacteriaceae bacterium]